MDLRDFFFLSEEPSPPPNIAKEKNLQGALNTLFVTSFKIAMVWGHLAGSAGGECDSRSWGVSLSPILGAEIA